MENDKQA